MLDLKTNLAITNHKYISLNTNLLYLVMVIIFHQYPNILVFTVFSITMYK